MALGHHGGGGGGLLAHLDGPLPNVQLSGLWIGKRCARGVGSGRCRTGWGFSQDGDGGEVLGFT